MFLKDLCLKRGGSTQGTGIMSHVEPRKQFNVGGPGFTLVGQPYTPGTGSPNVPMDPSKLSSFQKGELARNRVLYNLRNFGNRGLDFFKRSWIKSWRISFSKRDYCRNNRSSKNSWCCKRHLLLE